MKRSNVRRLSMESLENRALLAGNVLATVDAEGKLFVSGDALDNHIEIRQIPQPATSGEWQGATYEISNPWVPRGKTPTTVNGQASVIVEGVKSGVQINLGVGDDRLVIYRHGAAASVPGTVSVSMGEGNDQANLYVVNHQQMYVHLGPGTRDLLIMGGLVSGLNVLGDPHPTAGDPPPPAGTDEIHFFGLRIDGAALIDTAYGDDRMEGWFTTSNARATVAIETGAGNDYVGFTSDDKMTLNARLRIDTGSGNDAVSVSGVRSNSRLIINVGAGNDGISVSGLTLPSFVAWMGQGDDRLGITDTFYSDETILDGGDGTDRLRIGTDGNNHLGDKTITGFEIFE